MTFWPIVSHSVHHVARKGEDFHSFHDLVWKNQSSVENDDVGVSFMAFAVYDGHGGKDAAEYSKNHLVEEFMKCMTELSSGQTASSRTCWTNFHVKALQECFQRIDEFCRTEIKKTGTTATLVLILREQDHTDRPIIPGDAKRVLITVANVGDSSVYLDTKFNLIRLNDEHRAGANKQEARRIEESGGTISRVDPKSPYRLHPGGLMMTRTIGDRDALQAIAEPAISQLALRVERGGGGGRIILASDGLWDAVSPKECATMARKTKKTAACSNALMREASKREGRLGDDVTVVVVDISDVAASPYPSFNVADSLPNRTSLMWRPKFENAPEHFRALLSAQESKYQQAPPPWFKEREMVHDLRDSKEKSYKVVVSEDHLTYLESKGWIESRHLAPVNAAEQLAPISEIPPPQFIAPEKDYYAEAEEVQVSNDSNDTDSWKEVKSSRPKSKPQNNSSDQQESKSPEQRLLQKKSEKEQTKKKPKKKIASKTNNAEQPVPEQPISTEPELPKEDLFAVGFPDSWTEKELRIYFEKYAPVSNVCLSIHPETNEKGAFFSFVNNVDREKAESRIVGRHIIDTSLMFVVHTKDAFDDVL